jgi:hypothetical protein
MFKIIEIFFSSGLQPANYQKLSLSNILKTYSVSILNFEHKIQIVFGNIMLLSEITAIHVTN